MRALLMAAILVAASGCLGSRVPECEGTDLFLGEDEPTEPTAGAPLVVQALHDGGETTVFCVRIDDGPVHELVMGASGRDPNAGLVTETYVDDETFFVTAWTAIAPEQAVRETYPTTEENHVVLHLAANGTLTMRKFDERPVFE